MNERSYFCHHLAEWLFDSEWHFTTLLAAAINSVEVLPDDADSVINQLLLTYSDKPEKQSINLFLSGNTIVRGWFSIGMPKPKVIRFNLGFAEESILANNCLPLLQSANDIAQWLDITLKELDWMADLWRHDESTSMHLRHYHYSLAPKRDGSHRLIESPKTLLKRAQRKISDDIVFHMPVDDGAHGFRKGRNCQSHATLHTGKKYLIRFDLSNCFQSIQWPQIFSLFRALGYSATVSKYLTGICSHRCYTTEEIFKRIGVSDREKLKQRHLPQGAPSSPSLSNAVLIELDKRFSGLAKSLNLSYSRYADDFVFSGNNRRNWRTFSALVGSICLEQGFVLNYRKTRFTQSNQRQKITGIVVNEKVNIDRRYYDQLKAILTNCIRYGIHSQNRSGHANFEQHLQGRIAHVKSLNRNKGDKLGLLFDKIN